MRTRIDARWWDEDTWNGRPIGEYLACRDVAEVFRYLHARGVSFGTIGTCTGLSGNRVSEIARRAREVSAYDVLERIAVGLSIPRERMGLGVCPSPPAPPPAGHATTTPTVDTYSSPADTESAGGPWPALTRVRAELDEALAASTVSSAQVALIEESVAEHVQLYPQASPVAMLARLAGECVEVQRLSRRRQPATVQARLSGAAALLATMCADALMRLGATGEARLWYRTAVCAADDSTDTRLRVLVRAQAAMLPYYFGEVAQTVSLANAALELSSTPCVSTALAAAARARALARLGAGSAVAEAVAEARRVFDEVGEADTDVAFRFPAKRLLLYLSGAATWSGDTTRAYRLQDEALALYASGPASLIDPALLRLDRAMCLVQDRRANEAATIARQALAELPSAQRTELVLTRADDVVAATPAEERRGALAGLADYIAVCRHDGRTLAAGPATADE